MVPLLSVPIRVRSRDEAFLERACTLGGPLMCDLGGPLMCDLGGPLMCDLGGPLMCDLGGPLMCDLGVENAYAFCTGVSPGLVFGLVLVKKDKLEN